MKAQSKDLGPVSDFRQREIMNTVVNAMPINLAKHRDLKRCFKNANDMSQALFFYALISIHGQSYKQVAKSHNRSISFLRQKNELIAELRDRPGFIEMICQKLEGQTDGLSL